MNYDIKIVGEEEDDGSMEFDRLVALARATKDIATKALMFQLRGYSDVTPEKSIKKALQMYLSDVSGDEQLGTALTIDCRYFKETITGLQYDIFKPREEVLLQTPMSLVINAFHEAFQENTEEADLDKPLLKSLTNFKKNFISDNEIIFLSNRNTVPEVKLTRESFHKIEVLEESIPVPQNTIINGQLDEMKISKGKLGLQTNDGLVNLLVANSEDIKNLVAFMGKEITIKGRAHFRPNGKLSFIEISEFYEPGKSDTFFSIIPNAMTAKQQVLFQIKEKKHSNSLAALKSISGLLKDEISDNQLQEMLKDTHR